MNPAWLITFSIVSFLVGLLLGASGEARCRGDVSPTCADRYRPIVVQSVEADATKLYAVCVPAWGKKEN